MKTNLTFILVAMVAITSAAMAASGETGKVIRTVNWRDVPLPVGAQIQDKPGDSPTLLVKHDGAKALQLPLWKLDQPGIAKKYYALRGKVRYKDVAGVGYLEMWNVFPAAAAGQPDLRYFSRTMAPVGPLSQITGNSEWRDVFIPFDATDATQLPKALELNLSLAGAGEVELTSFVLVEFQNAETMWGGTIMSTASVPRPPNEIIGRYIMGAAALGGLAVAGALAWLIVRRSRLLAEARRMKAMDAMP